MGLDIYIDVCNREARDEANAENKEIRERNNKVYQERGDDAELEAITEIPYTQQYYFRKFTALIEWIENNVGDLKDCGELELNEDNIKGLQAMLSNLTPPKKRAKQVRTRSGFSFGEQEQESDEWCGEDIENAKKMCDNILAQTDWEKDVVTILIFY